MIQVFGSNHRCSAQQSSALSTWIDSSPILIGKQAEPISQWIKSESIYKELGGISARKVLSNCIQNIKLHAVVGS